MDKKELDELLSSSMVELPLETRISNALNDNMFFYLGQIVRSGPDRILMMRNIGRVSLKKLCDFLETAELTLGRTYPYGPKEIRRNLDLNVSGAYFCCIGRHPCIEHFDDYFHKWLCNISFKKILKIEDEILVKRISDIAKGREEYVENLRKTFKFHGFNPRF